MDVHTLTRDLRYSLRLLAREPGFAILAVLTLALGIGAATAIFTVVDSVLLRPLPYKDSGRLVVALHGPDASSPVSMGIQPRLTTTAWPGRVSSGVTTQ